MDKETAKAGKQTQPEQTPSNSAKRGGSAQQRLHPVPQLQSLIGNRATGLLLQTKLAVSQPGDVYEQEADRVADQVMRTHDQTSPVAVDGPPQISRLQRKCAECEEEEIQRQPMEEEEEEAENLQAKEAAGQTPEVTPSMQAQINGLRDGGQPLPEPVRAFFEPRFKRDFSQVRLHTDERAAESARSINALAYTVGSDIVFNSGQYQPQTSAGKGLLAHELVHVVQQGKEQSGQDEVNGRVELGTIQRQTITPSCAAHQSEIRDAWSRASGMVNDTIASLESIKFAMGETGGPRSLMPRMTRCVDVSFGDVGGLEGGQTVFTLIDTVTEKFRRIQGGFSSGKNLRCDPETVADNECDWRVAFVVVGNASDIFLCPGFFARDNSPTSRAVTLIHEMAHSVLRIAHQGIPERTFPPTFFDYSTPLGLEFDDAKQNAFAYEILANCLHGEPPSSVVELRTTPTSVTDRRWAGSAMGGATVTLGPTPALQGLAGLAGRYSLREGSLVVFNPYIGLNLLYSPTTESQPHLFTGMAEVGLRVQQPLRGAYLDVSAGGFLGFEAPVGNPLEFTGGLAGGLGAGWRWERIELGAETRAQIPLTEGDPSRVLILGRFTTRF